MKYIYILFIAFAACMFTACSEEDENYDVLGDTTNRVFVNTPTTNINDYRFTVVHTPVSSFGDVIAKFPARATQVAKSDIQVTFVLDNSLVDQYNEENYTAYNKLPEEMISISPSTVTISKGEMISTDSITVSVTGDLSQLTKDEYMLAVRISSISNGAEISRNLNTVLFRVDTKETNLYDSPEASDMTGVLISDKSLWTASADVMVYYGLSNMFNDNANSYWLAPPQEMELIVDLGEEVSNISGIRFNTFSWNYSLTTVGVSTSVDGEEWVSHGITELSTNSAYQFIKFYSDVDAQFLRIDILGWVSGQYIVFSQFDVYQTEE